METFQLESLVRQKLIQDETIMGLLPNGDKSIYHYKSNSKSPAYPIIVVSAVSDVPVLHGDNREKLHRVIIRIHIIIQENTTAQINNAYETLYLKIKDLMADLEFTREQTREMATDGVKMLVADFKIITGG